MSETDISTAAVEAHARRLRDHGHSGTHGILPVTLALLADRDRLQRENDNLRQIERNVQAVREKEHKRANAAEAERDRLAAEVARLNGLLDGWDAGFATLQRALTLEQCCEAFRAFEAAHAARREGEA